MIQSLYPPKKASEMMIEMCDRVKLSRRAGSYIFNMRRLENKLPGGLVDMFEMAQLIKYVSEHQEDLKPQFKLDSTDGPVQKEPSSNRFTFLK